jgi:hypothetical protein
LEHAGCGATARAEVRCEQGHEVPLESYASGVESDTEARRHHAEQLTTTG